MREHETRGGLANGTEKESNADSEDDDFKPKRSTRSKGKLSSASVVPVKSIKSKPARGRKSKPSIESAIPQQEPEDISISQGNVSQCHGVSPEETPLKEEMEPETGSEVTKNVASNSFEYCPICQVPLKILKISAALHTASCDPSSGYKDACPEHLSCLSSDIFHYRDYSHYELAAFRDSEDFVEPDITFTPRSAKSKRSPSKSSGRKRRSSKSPIVSGSKTKVTKREGQSCSKDLTPVSCSPDLFAVDPPTSLEQKRKLSFSEDPDDPVEQIPQADTVACEEQFSEPPESLGISSVWCSDLLLSPREEDMVEPTVETDVDGNTSPTCAIKAEPESQNSEEQCVAAPEDGKDLSVAAPLASNAQVTVHYLDDPEEQDIKGAKVDCSGSCKIVQLESQDSLKANCSFIFKASGVNRAEAMARSPMSVSLMVNNSGWQALEIKGTKSTSLQKLDVSLCQCGHSVSVECCINNRDAFTGVKFNTKDLEQQEIFFTTMADMGLRQEPSFIDFTNRKQHFISTCNQVTIASLVGEGKSPASVCLDQNEVIPPVINEERNQTAKLVDAFALLKKTSNHGRLRPDTPTSISSGSNSRPSTPTSGAMVVSRSTGSSWTLVPGTGLTNSSAGRARTATSNKKVPAYKRIPDTNFVVDAFNFGIIPGVKIYFLSHFHSDHYMGLGKNFDKPVYCSQVTANLVYLKLKVAKQHLYVLKIGEPRVVCGVEVEVFDAFHCPGAVMFLFRLLDGRVFLHVGDFRAHPSMENYPQLRLVNKLYLDTTYCDPAYDFPSQEEVVHKVIETIREHLAKNKSILIASGTYTIGKEKVFLGIAKAFDFKVWASGEKRKIFQCLEDEELSKRLTTNPFDAQIHVLPMRDIALEELQNHLAKYSPRYSNIIGLKPTGWQTSTTLKGKPSDFQRMTRGKVTIYGVPYSEHSSYSELCRFVRYIKPKDIQVTVNVGKAASYKKTFHQWLSGGGESQLKMNQYFTKEST